jgi:hypothetical protein
MAEIIIGDITEGSNSVTGDGAFDEMMKATSAHLHVEYHKNRIKGTDYSTVYLGAMQTTMQQAIGYVLGRQMADKQAELIDKQIDLADVDLIGKKLDNQLKEKQLEKMEWDIALTKAQIAKVTGEAALVAQKKITEDAQTEGVVIMNPETGIPRSSVGGNMGEQMALYNMQKHGFMRNSEAKVAKMFADNYAVRRSTNDTELVDDTGMFDFNIREAMRVAADGIKMKFYDDVNDVPT